MEMVIRISHETLTFIDFLTRQDNRNSYNLESGLFSTLALSNHLLFSLFQTKILARLFCKNVTIISNRK
jgi:hypothetical protein